MKGGNRSALHYIPLSFEVIVLTVTVDTTIERRKYEHNHLMRNTYYSEISL